MEFQIRMMSTDAKIFTDSDEKAFDLLRERDLLQIRLEVLDKRLEIFHMKVGIIMGQKDNR